MSKLTYVLAEFESPRELLDAAEKLRDKGYEGFDAHSPFPIHGMDAAMGLKDTPLAWIVLGAGLTGFTVAVLLQTWVATSAYKLVISGKPLFSYQAFVPVTFELTVLFSAFAAVFGMFALNKLPLLYHSIFKSKHFLKASSHGFFISVPFENHKVSHKDTMMFLESIGGKNLESIYE